MKRTLQITGILLMLCIAGNLPLNAQRGMRGEMDSLRMNRSGRDNGFRQMKTSGSKEDSLNFRPKRDGFARGRMDGRFPGWQYGMRNGMHPDFSGPMGMRPEGPWSRPGMRDGMPPEMSGRIGMRPAGPGMMRIESIQSLTDKQKSEIASIRKQQQEEMEKFRAETADKIKAMREDHHKKLMGVLTEEQKKLLVPAPAK